MTKLVEKTEFKTAIYSTGMVLIDADYLSDILGISSATISKLASPKNSSALPPRFDLNASSVRWLLRDVWRWLDARSKIPDEAEAALNSVAPDPAHLQKPMLQTGRGRPNQQVAAAARAAGLSVSEYRRKNQQAGV